MEKRLYLIPVDIGHSDSPPLSGGVSPALLEKLHIIFAENLRSARRAMRKAGYSGDLDRQTWIELNEKTPVETLLDAVRMITPDTPGGILSEAGMPGVADPGASVVALAHECQVRVIPVPGPSSIILALAASGLDGQCFTFHGYLPVNPKEREKRLRQIEQTILQTGYTQILMETPYRNEQMLASIQKVCNPGLRLCVAADITGEQEMIRTHTLQDWKKKKVNLHKLPALFLLNQ